MSIEGKTALVTGGSRGIGRAIAFKLASHGAKVIINYASNEVAAQETAELILEAGFTKPQIAQFRVENDEEVTQKIRELSKENSGIDILVNNAGVTSDGLFLRYKAEEFDRVLKINLTGSFACAKVCARDMLKKRWGRIINISSVVALSGNIGQVAYVSAKSAVLGMTKALAKELGSRNITVNCVAPGLIETDMTNVMTKEAKGKMISQIPLGRAGRPEEIAHACTFLASEEAGYVTGHILNVSGGLYM